MSDNCFSALMDKRRSVRKFTVAAVEESKIDEMLRVTMTSPSSKNRRPWKFAVVRDKQMIEKLAKSKPTGADFVKDAPLAIVVMGDMELSDMWVEDCSIAATVLQLSAESLGLGSCWVQVRGRSHNDEILSEDYVKDLLKADAKMGVLCIVTIGYDAAERRPAKEYDDLDKIINF